MITDERLAELLKTDRIPKIVFLFGEEYYIIKHYVNQIEKLAVTENPDFNICEIKLEPTAQKIFDAVDQLPMFAEKRCVTVCDYNHDKISENEFKNFLGVISDVPETTVLVFYCETVYVNPKKPSARAKKLMAAVEKAGGAAVYAARRNDSQLIRMVTGGASKRGLKMTPTAARHLIEVSGSDIFTLINELEKLSAFSKDGVATEEMIDKICSHSVDATIYNLSKFVLSKNTDGAQKLLDELLFMRTEPVYIISTLASTYIDMVRAAAAERKGIPVKEAAKDFGYPPTLGFRLTNAARDAVRLPKGALLKSLGLILDSDRRIKTGTTDPKAELQTLITELVLTAERR